MQIIEETWWLMNSSFPNLNWARLREFDSGVAEVFDMDGATHKFKNKSEAMFWLCEDEFTQFCNLDYEDEALYQITISNIHPPKAKNDKELKKLMYVKKQKA